MKFGMRKPSVKKSFKARTTGRLKRSVKKAVNPLYGKKGVGFIKDPAKSVKGAVYRRTTFSIFDVFKGKKAAHGAEMPDLPKPKKKQPYTPPHYENVTHTAPKKPQEEIQAELDAQSNQIAAVQAATAEYEQTGDVQQYIDFWESIWNNGGLLFNGSIWTFKLPDIYIQLGRYEDALRILNLIDKPAYAEKRDDYIKRVQELQRKAEKRDK